MGSSPAYFLTAAARDDIGEIWIHIADDNPAAADTLEEDFFAAFERLANQPGLGHWRRDLTDKPVRFFAVRRHYLVVYAHTPDIQPLEIIRVLHGARDAGSLLQ